MHTKSCIQKSEMLQRKAFEHAKALIEQGKVDLKSDWEFTTQDENKLLGDPPDWERYALWFLYRDPEANPETKKAYKYPYGKSGKVYYRALIAIRVRAAQHGEQEIFDAAGKLLNMIREKYSDAFSDETDWIEIFRAGSYPQGEITEEDIDEIVKNYDPTYHEAPVVIGHPEHDSPAYGWVSKLKRVGKSLFAKFRDVTDELKELVRAGRYKKISVALYPDLDGKGLYLRHVGFLGAQPPQVKGLEPVRLNEDEGYQTFELENNGGLEMKDQQRQERAEIQAELERKLKELDEAKRKLAEFSEKLEELKRQNKRLELERYIDGLMQKGVVTKAFCEMGLVDFMMTLQSDKELTFAERKMSQLEWFKMFLESLPKSVEFGELFKGDGVSKGSRYVSEGPVDQESLKLHEKALQFLEEGKAKTYEQAVFLALKQSN